MTVSQPAPKKMTRTVSADGRGERQAGANQDEEERRDGEVEDDRRHLIRNVGAAPTVANSDL